MSNPTNDPKVDLARGILDESRRLHTQGATRHDLLYYLGRVQQACTLLLEVVDEPAREPRIPDTAHRFVRTDGGEYRCERCHRVADSDSVYRLSILEECPGGGQQ